MPSKQARQKRPRWNWPQREKANADRDLKPAADWADQANIDAQVAEATASLARSKKAAMEFDAGLQALRQEAARSSQPAQ
jgi:hypothetical protein